MVPRSALYALSYWTIIGLPAICTPWSLTRFWIISTYFNFTVVLKYSPNHEQSLALSGGCWKSFRQWKELSTTFSSSGRAFSWIRLQFMFARKRWFQFHFLPYYRLRLPYYLPYCVHANPSHDLPTCKRSGGIELFHLRPPHEHIYTTLLHHQGKFPIYQIRMLSMSNSTQFRRGCDLDEWSECQDGVNVDEYPISVR